MSEASAFLVAPRRDAAGTMLAGHAQVAGGVRQLANGTRANRRSQ